MRAVGLGLPIILGMLGWVVACGDSDPLCIAPSHLGPQVRFADPDSVLTDLVDHPFPSDALLLNDGRVQLEQFPNPTNASTLQDYLLIFQSELRGFATSAALYVGFTEAMDQASFSTDAGTALTTGASVYLVDIDPDSPEQGRRYPLQLRYRDEPSVYLPAHHLIILPPFGATLRGGTTYALILTRDVRSATGEPLQRSAALDAALRAECEDRAPPRIRQALSPLKTWLQSQADPEAVAGATVFTTRDSVADVRALADAVRSLAPVTATDWRLLKETQSSVQYTAEVRLPGFQAGRRPYWTPTDGGDLVRTPEGFAVDHFETTRISVAVPRGGSMPVDGWPVVLYSHGTGGSHLSALQASVADVLASRGIATIGYDGTLHGPRAPAGTDPNLAFFNLFNPVAARANVLQGAADLVAMTRAVPVLTVPTTVGPPGHRFDAGRLAFLGHSQGALVGAPYLSADDTPRAVVFSGHGAILTITLLQRKDIADFEALLTLLLGLPDNTLDEFHPVVNLFQQFIEPGDPIAYARAFNTAPGASGTNEGRERGPTAILMVEGLEDRAAPPLGQEAFSVAARLPVIEPVARLPLAATWLGPDPEPAPAFENVVTGRGRATYGLLQYRDETHFPIFRNADANHRYAEFLRSALFEEVTVIPAAR